MDYRNRHADRINKNTDSSPDVAVHRDNIPWYIDPIRSLMFIIVLALFSLFFLPKLSYSQYFGQNKVNYDNFDWYYIRTEHFDIYHPKDEFKIAEFTAWEAEEALQSIQNSWNYSLNSRITFIVYPNHNAFQQNNIGGFVGESTGGFTEFLKNRVVIPFEGSYSQFRHVIHHELTHAVMLRMLYGEGIQSILSGLSRMPLPLWFIEGLAEYESQFGWSNEADMYIRDAVINDYLPPINRLSGYFFYKGGQSVLYYIDQRYGSEKVGEILRRIRSHRDLNRAIKKALGFDLEELSKRWHKHVKREIWPVAANHESPTDFAEKFTDHEKWYNFINTSPALSPDGDKMVLLSDKDDYLSLYLFSTVTGKIERKLITGQRVELFEKLLWIRPWVGWSHDSRYLAFIAESGPEDALYILDVETGEVVKKMSFGLDGIFSPVWSPDGTRITLAGFDDGQSDIYLVNIEEESIRKLTDDIFSDYDPSWDPNGERILFISDRNGYLGQPGEEFNMWDHDYEKIDVYMLDLESGKLHQVTDDKFIDRTPSWTSAKDTVSFVSDRNGIANIYLMDLNDGSSWPITDVLTGIVQPSWSQSGTVAFSTFHEGGYDVYLYKNPLDTERRKDLTYTAFQQKENGNLPTASRNKGQNELAGNLVMLADISSIPVEDIDILRDTEPSRHSYIVVDDSTDAAIQASSEEADEESSENIVVESSGSEELSPSDSLTQSELDSLIADSSNIIVRKPEERGVRFVPDDEPGDIKETRFNPYSNYVFSPNNIDNESAIRKANAKQGPLLDEDGNFIQRKYKLKFSPDIVNATAGYNTFFGLQGMGQVLFSDILGNHLFYLTTDLYYSFENSNFSLYYYNLPQRADFGGGVFHNVYFFNLGDFRDRNYGASFDFLYPISKYKRFDFSAAFVNIDRDVWNPIKFDYEQAEKRHFILPSLALVSDNTLWGWTGPMNGRRWRIGVSYSPKFEEYDTSKDDIWGIDFRTLSLDVRQYHHFGLDYVHMFRFAGAASWGEQPQRFFVGGVSNWINRRFSGGDIRVTLDDVYFSGFATPLRGADYYELDGTRYVLINNEFRFPLIRHMLFGWPLPFFFYNIRGAMFLDMGAAWYGNNFNGLTNAENEPQRFEDIAVGYGWGARVNLGAFILKWDMAWENDWQGVSKPKYYVSLGTDL